MPDIGFTHVALAVASVPASVAFYERYTDLQVVHRRADGSAQVVWLSDSRRPFVLVLAEGQPTETPIGPFGHLGIGCPDRGEVDRLAALADGAGCLVKSPEESGLNDDHLRTVARAPALNLDYAFTSRALHNCLIDRCEHRVGFPGNLFPWARCSW